MKINIFCVGKLSKDLIPISNDYTKKISKYAEINIIEIKEEPIPLKPSEGDIKKALLKEGEAILNKLSDKEFVIALYLKGIKMDSLTFAKTLNVGFLRGQSTISFIIGGSNGLSEAVYERANKCISFSDLTFPHQLFRIMLLEQIFRGFKINNNETYHK